MELLFRFFERLDRKGPGSSASTERALALVPGRPESLRILELGCGSGIATLLLAEAGASLCAVDLHQPFLDALMREAVRRGLAERIETRCADMAQLDGFDQPFDVVWCESAVYAVGVEQALEAWKRVLRPGGTIVFSDCVWRTDHPSDAQKAFWNKEYPAMVDVAENLRQIADAGYDSVGHFVQPNEDWEDYYGPMERELERFRTEYAGNPELPELVDSLTREIEIYRTSRETYGHAFFVARLPRA